MIHYQLSIADTRVHSFDLLMTVPEPAAAVVVALPVWIPGSYLVREFARHLSHLQASQGGRHCAVTQVDKASWRIACTGSGDLVLSYRVYAFDTSVRTAFLDAARGFFNGSSVFLRVVGREREAHEVRLDALPAGWHVATAMPSADGGSFQAADYDEVVDHPFELGNFWRGGFEAAGVAHEFVVAGALPSFDGERLLADAKRICETAIALWHGSGKPPFERYLFMLNVVDDGYGGLEHRASTALIAARRDLPRKGMAASSDGYVTLLGLVSHEYFHAWNVKRMRPDSFARYDYTQENYTELLWFFEGFTSYYDDLLLRRAGLIDDARYLKLVAKALSGVLATPGRLLQSVAKASFDAWVKFYRPEENTPNATVSYYGKGALIALALDLSLRAAGTGTLDDVMRRLWQHSEGGPISEADIARALQAVSGRSFDAELQSWVHGTDDLPLQPLLKQAGVAWTDEVATSPQRFGLRVAESALTGIQVKGVLRGGSGEAAGLAAGDEVLAVNEWRLRRLDDMAAIVAPGEASDWLISRDQRLLRLRMPAGTGTGAVTLAPMDPSAAAALALRQAWLGG